MGMGGGGGGAWELEKKVKRMLKEAEEEDDVTHSTFGQRAEAYYSKRPQLLSLLNTLYTSYLSLSHRPHQHRRLPSDASDVASSSCVTAVDSDADSAVTSCFHDDSPPAAAASASVVERMVEEVVMRSVNTHLAEKMKEEELGRKVELQRRLVEVLEAERMILLKENASLRYDNRALGWEAAELGRCLMRLRRDHHRSSSLLAAKIGELQEQLQNRDYTQQQQQMRRRKDREVRPTMARWWDRVSRINEFLLCGSGQGQGQGKGRAAPAC